MSVLVIWASPNDEGITCTAAKKAAEGIAEVGKKTEVIKLNSLKINRCLVCGTGYGICNQQGHKCIQNDDLNMLRERLIESDGVVLVTPVYYGEMSEPMKAFLDRVRRCEGKSGRLGGKKCIVIACAGGSGNGAADCLVQMDRYCKNVGMEVCDRLPVIRFNKKYMYNACYEAGKALAEII